MATHSSILAWRIPRIEEPGRLQSVGSQRGGHNWSDLAHKRGLFCLWSLIQVDWVRWELPSRCCYFSVAHLCPTFCDAMDCSKSGFPVLHYLLEFAQTHVHWVSDAISSSVAPFSTCLQSVPASGSFPRSRFFLLGGQSIGPSTSESVLLMNIQGWFPLGLTGLISLQSKGLSRVFSSTTVQKHEFFGAQPSLWSNSHIHTWLLEN